MESNQRSCDLVSLFNSPYEDDVKRTNSGEYFEGCYKDGKALWVVLRTSVEA